MSKRGGFPGMGGFGGMNINQLMKEAKKMQADIEKSQTELQAKEFDATAGGGAVSVKVTGSKEIKEITKDDVFMVWCCKTLQNNKALLSTTLFDGMYYECTYNGDKEEMYFDAYKKWENKKIVR